MQRAAPLGVQRNTEGEGAVLALRIGLAADLPSPQDFAIVTWVELGDEALRPCLSVIQGVPGLTSNACFLRAGDPWDLNETLWWAQLKADRHRAEGDLASAAQALRSGLELQPHSTLLLFALGDLLHELGDHAGARAAWSRGVREDDLGQDTTNGLRDIISPENWARTVARYRTMLEQAD